MASFERVGLLVSEQSVAGLLLLSLCDKLDTMGLSLHERKARVIFSTLRLKASVDSVNLPHLAEKTRSGDDTK